MPKKKRVKAKATVDVKLSKEEAGITLGILLLAQGDPKEFGLPIPDTLNRSIDKLRIAVHKKA